MSAIPKKLSEHQEKPAVPAVIRARDMLCDLSGPRGWNDTRESWLARGARRAGLSLRRARALFYQEPIRLTADEYLAIEEAFQRLWRRFNVWRAMRKVYRVIELRAEAERLHAEAVTLLRKHAQAPCPLFDRLEDGR